ncbi:DUF6055 domain-containing protein [Hallella bergensis]|uniref:DUF6055 domain-containing protein n=1 Tax=Hallella bergensis TaxID=242750 RepID=UPI0023EFD0D7|nr:DUF6055 domain-containing protein [Hallella bergensis]
MITIFRKLFNRSAYTTLLLILGMFVTSGCGNDELPEPNIMIDDSELIKNVTWNEMESSITFTSTSAWTATCSDVTTRASNVSLGWLKLTKPSGEAGTIQMPMVLTKNDNDSYREAQIVIRSGNKTATVTIHQEANPDAVHTMSPSDIPDYDKFYCPKPHNEGFEKGPEGLLRSDNKWSWFRHKQSEHYVVFWEPGFGDDPNAASVPEELRVDVDDLLAKAERFYNTNINKLKMVRVGGGKSQLDKYKMEIFLLYQTEWLATGSGYDNTIGALWVNPSTCKPVGQTIAHEIGHCFQYQTYCDNIMNGKANDLHSGYRYGLPGSNGGNAFWEQCAQWQSFQDYPELALTSYDFDVYVKNNHRHFEHEFMRYASYWFHYYAAKKHGYGMLGNLWNESRYPEDALQTYMRLYCGNSYEVLKTELFDFAQRIVTFDIDMDGVKNHYTNQDERFASKFYKTSTGSYRISYSKCPGATGFNVIPLDVPQDRSQVSVKLKGLPAGTLLADDDPGVIVDADGKKVGTTRNYNNVGTGQGWSFGFVALKDNGTRVYGEMNHTYSTGKANFTVPEHTNKLFLIVQGAPKSYQQCPWDDKEISDYQCPYEIEIDGTSLSGYFNVDTNKTPENLTLTYNLNCNAAFGDYILGTINLNRNGDIKKICQALGIEPYTMAGKTLAIENGTTAQPAEGKVAFGLLQADNTISFSYSSNGGFYVKANGDRGTWGNGDPIWVEYDKDNFVITYGHYPSKSISDTKYILKPVLVYTKGGKQYKVKLTITMQF